MRHYQPARRRFGRRPYISPRVRRARRINRIAAVCALIVATGLGAAALNVMDAANNVDAFADPRHAGIAALLAMAAVAAMFVGFIAATEA